MNTHPPHGYRRIYPDDAPGSRNEKGDTSHVHTGSEDSNHRQSTRALPAIRPPNPYKSSRESGAGADSRHIHYHHHHNHAYFLPPAPVPHQPPVAAGVVRAFDERRTRYGCAPTCLVVSALLTGGVIALLVVAMGLALVGQILALPSSAPTASPTPAYVTPTHPAR
ncbi:MAG TPA: hypothetical protein VFU63_15005 [Ktedonobacterales bacterium]|nr:hypothetical protein [Ktedonobacterales bacterium]